MKPMRQAVRAVVVAIVTLASSPVSAQFGAQLGTAPPTGQPVAPYFEGWYANPDGTYTFSFGYHNFNFEGSLDIPIGPNNFITPPEFDRGEQPTFFPTSPRRDRGLFTVTVPAAFGDGRDVVWTLTVNGETLHVPAHVGISAYQLDHAPKPAGSLPPVLKFSPDSQALFGPSSVIGNPDAPGADVLGTFRNPLRLSGKVGEPVTIRVWVADNIGGESRDTTEIHTRVFKHQGPPGPVEFTDAQVQDDGSVTATATFGRQGEYVLRVTVDSFGAEDSSAGAQCCWTNGYVRVTVGP